MTMKPVTRMQAAGLCLLAALLLAVAWLTDRPAGPVMALAGGVIGWLVCRMSAPVAALPPADSTPAASSVQERDEWTKQFSALRHDLRGILSPAMLIADRLLAHQDPAVQRAGEVVNRTVERAAARLAEKPPS